MALSLSTIAAKDSAGTAIAGGLLAGDKSGAGTGPFVLGNLIVDGAAGTNLLGIDASGRLTANAVQSGTWTVQPGNTANTTSWKVQLYDGTTNLPILAGSSGAPAASAPALAVSVRDANANGQTTMNASAPVAIASDQTVIIKGTTTSSGLTNSRVVSAATTNATSLKASAGNVFSIRVFNVAAYDVYLKLYNKASAPTVGTDTPIWTIPLKTGTGYSEHFHLGLNFSTGIAYAITKLQADTDTTAVAASDVTGTIGWI